MKLPDTNFLDNSEVMTEFFKLCKTNNEPKEFEVLEDSKIIEKAHPEPVYVAESQGDGALVENQIEQQKKDIDVINKMPNGVLVQRHAELFNELIKFSEKCEKEGNIEDCNLVLKIAKDVLNSIPFVSAPKG